MKVLIDTNIALDVLLNRKEFYEDSSKILVLSENRVIDGYISASAITDIYYVSYKVYKNKETVFELLNKLLQVVNVASVTDDNIHNALNLKWDDFEDSLQYVIADSIIVDYIVTRNADDFKVNDKVITPKRLIQVILNTSQGNN
jgi:predicted nucleic acid-binding protein